MSRVATLVTGFLFAGVVATAAQDPPPSPPPPPPEPPVVVEDSTGSAAAAVAVALFTERQAKRGQDTYKQNCLECHSARAYTGAAFRRAWVGRSAFEIWEQIRTTMPENNPGLLDPEQYADIVAYLLKLNGYSGGEDELPATEEALRQVVIAPLPPKAN